MSTTSTINQVAETNNPKIFIAFLIFLAVLFLVYVFNKFTMLRNKIKQSKSSIDVYLTQRFDLIPNLVECVKGYAKYEQETLTKIVELRSKYNSTGKSLKDGNELNSMFNKLLSIGENNPDLKASEQFLDLQKSLEKMESQLQAARRLYNGDVTLYNTTIATFPNSIFAKMFGFQEADLFVIEEGKEQNVKIDI